MMHAICISILILIFFQLEFFIKFRAFFDIYENKGEVHLYVFFIRVLKARLSYRPDSSSAANIEIHFKKRAKEIHLNNDIKDEKSISRLAVSRLFSNLNIVEVLFNASVGGSNALNTAVLMGTVKIMFYSVAAALKSRQHFIINEKFTPVFHAQVLRIETGGIFNISIADIIYGFVLHLMEKSRKIRKEKKSLLQADRQANG